MKKKNNLIAVLLIFYDIIAANLAYGLALWLRFENIHAIPEKYLMSWVYFIPIFSALVVVVFAAFRLYVSIWKYVGYREIIKSFIACTILGLLHFIDIRLYFVRMSVSYYIIGWLLMFVFLTGVRMSYRFARIIKNIIDRNDDSLERVLVVGGGEAGRLIIREFRNREPMLCKVICVADDAQEKIGKTIEGVLIRGTIQEVPQLVDMYSIDRVIIAIPSADKEQKRTIINKVKLAGCDIGILPGLTDLVNNPVDLEKIRDVDIEDLLGRDAVSLDNTKVGELLKDKIILVTGGGGSIGSELVRQIVRFMPKRLILFDVYENGVYDIQQEIIRAYPEIDLEIIIGSICDENTVRHLFDKYRPDIVYHAAAHKHVPLMEAVPCEAIKNNVMGTYYLAKAASDFGTDRFLLISTDKAVNPTNIMGASKRLCEMVVKAMDEKSDTDYMAVRFGNVLGSSGSVVPLFKRQIREGGPVTVTHPEITRFFMTIPEAVSLVLQSGAYAKGGELFVLDMGEPVKIDDLARNLIELSGLVPDVDIKIEYTGLRPGEKLYEELLMEGEIIGKTDNALIYIGKQSEIPKDFFETLNELYEAAEANADDMIERVAKVVETYEPKRDNAAFPKKQDVF